MIIKSIREIEKSELKSFSCGNEELNTYLKNYALKNDYNGYGKTYVLVEEKEIIGFFTLCSSSIQYEEFPNKYSEHFPRYSIPAIKIARLAIRVDKQGQGYGKELLMQALLKVVNVASAIGVRLIVVDAKESSASFYEKYGFLRLCSNNLTYYLLVETVLKAIS